MPRPLLLCFYNLVFPIVALVAFPGWLLKMKKRGGYGTGLKQRLGRYNREESEEKKGGVYVHAVSVGEVMIALKLIREWERTNPKEFFVLVATTSTGHAVAREKASDKIRVIYSPIDLPWVVKKVLNRFEPKVVVLIESEMWLNLLNQCREKKVPVHLVNARLSARSERRYKKLKWLTKPLFAMLESVMVQYEEDEARWRSIGVKESQIVHTGSVKFDYSGAKKPSKKEEYKRILDKFQQGRRIVMLLSSFPGEEYALAKELSSIYKDIFLVVAPRHMERRLEVAADLARAGFSPVLRSNIEDKEGEQVCLIIDSTGELSDWTAHADLAVIGKSWYAKGGQNPAEAIAAEVPVIVGPYMGNFEPLVSQLELAKGLVRLDNLGGIPQLLTDRGLESKHLTLMADQASRVIELHSGAAQRAINRIVNTL